MSVNTTQERLEFTAVDKAGQVIKSIRGDVQGLHGDYQKLGTAAAAAFAGGGAAAFITDATRYRSMLQDIHDTTGDNVRTLDALARQYRITRGDVEGLAPALNKLAVNLNNTDEEGNAAAQAVKALGLNLRELQAMKPADAMLALAKGMNEFADGDAKLAVSRALFGKDGPSQLKFMKDLAEATGLQGNLTADQVAQAEQLEKGWRRLIMAFSDSKQEIASNVIPYLGKMIEQFQELIRLGGGVGGAIRMAFSLGPVSSAQIGDKIGETQAALEKWQQAGPIGKFFQKPLGATYAGTEGDLKKQLEFLKFMERQGAMEGVGEGSLDARDLLARQKPTLDFKPASTKAARDERDKSAAIWAESLQKNNELLYEAQKLSDDYVKTLAKEAEAVRALIDPSRLYNDEEERLNKLVYQNAITQEEANKALRKWFEAKNGIKDLGDTASTAADAGHAMGLSFTSSIERIIFDSGRAVTALDVMRAMAMDVAKVIYGRNVAEPVAAGVQGLFKDLFKTSGDNVYVSGTMTNESAGMLGQAFHTGGVVGHDSAPGRFIHPAYFENAPRFHGGLMPDEFPAILQRGEGVFTSAQMSKMGGGGDTYVIDARGSDRVGYARLAAVLRAQGAAVEEQSYSGLKRRMYTRAQKL